MMSIVLIMIWTLALTAVRIKGDKSHESRVRST